MRVLPGHLLQHLFRRGRGELGVVSVRHHTRGSVGHLLFHDLGVELCRAVKATQRRDERDVRGIFRFR